MTFEPHGFKNLGNFCDNDFEDSWEENESIDDYDSERYKEKEFIASGAEKNVSKVYDTKDGASHSSRGVA